MKFGWKRAVAICLSAVITAGAAIQSVPGNVADAAKKTYVIVLDPGHDTAHTGARRTELTEESVNFNVAKYAKQALLRDYSNVKVYLTRNTEECAFGAKAVATRTCLEKRPELAKKKKADVFVSIHMNTAANSVASGAETWYPTAYAQKKVGKDSHALAQKIQAKLVKAGLKNRGLKGSAGLIVIKRANEYGIPACLVEHGFMSNPVDRKWMTTTAKLKKMGQADADGIAEYLGLKKSKNADEDYEEEEDEEDYDDDDDDDYDDYDDDYDYLKEDIKADSSKASSVSKTATGKKAGSNTVHLDRIRSSGFASLEISWQPYPNANGYAVYRRARSGEDETDYFEKLGNTKETKYLDETCKPGVTYQYTVRAFGKGFKTGNTRSFLTKKTRTGGVVGFKAVRGVFNSVNMTWEAKNQADGYEIWRAEEDEDYNLGKYGLVTTIDDTAVVAYTDMTSEPGKTYKYRIRAFHGKGKSRQYGSYITRKLKTSSNRVSGLGVRRVDTTTAKLTWKAVSKASGYEVSRALGNGSSKFTVLSLVDDGSRSYTDDSINTTGTFRYRVRAYHIKDSETYWGEYSETVTLGGTSSSSSASTPIAGSAKTTVTQMKNFYVKSGRKYPSDELEDKGAPTIDDFVNIVYEEATDEDIRPEVVFAQICKETRYLEFGGDVEASQCNFAGLGATSSGEDGEAFSNVRQGVRAQVQHLKAYANTEPLVHSKVDPRFHLVKRGSAKYVEWLGIKENPNGTGWASDKNYGYSLKEDFLDVLLGS